MVGSAIGEFKVRYLFVLGSGGHTTRGLLLSKRLEGEVYYIVPWESEHTKNRVKKNYFSVVSPRFRAKANTILTIIRTVFLFCHSLILLVYIRPKCVISTGSGLSLPVILIAQFLHMNTVYIESPSRVYTPSITGKLLLGKVDLWLGAWIELTKYSSSIKYMGLLA